MKKRYIYLLIVAMILLFVIGTSAAKPSARGAKPCRDRIDNDGDGYIDLNDPGCANKNDASELNSAIECDDGIDNDGDGNIDSLDYGCSSPTDTDESDCGDGICEGEETSGNCPADCGIPDSCSDTDGGNYPLVFGTTSGYYSNNPYSNDDYCVDSSSVMEHYCSGDYEQTSEQSCGTDGYSAAYCSAGDTIYKDFTDYFCAGGACGSNVTAVFQEDCDASDGYVGSDYCLGGDVYRDYRDYSCSAGGCVYNETAILQTDCVTGQTCTAGACVWLDSCADTDGGIVEGVFGTTSGYYNDLPYSSDDYCVDSDSIIEYSCSGDYEQSQQISCGTDSNSNNYCAAGDTIYFDSTDYFCSGGACDSTVTPVFVEDCDDSDGYTANYCSANLVKKDYQDYFCSGGACDYASTPETVEDCDDSDGYVGSDYCLGGDVYRDYRDYSCSAGGCVYNETAILQTDCVTGQTCTAGACVWLDSCADTDGGNYPDVFGTTSGYSGGSPYSNDDYCVDNSTIMEFFCSGTVEQSTQQSCGNDSYGAAYCDANWRYVYQNLTDYFCSGGTCDSTVTPEIIEDCDALQGYSEPFCMFNNATWGLYRNYTDGWCWDAKCNTWTEQQLLESCTNGCFNATCY